MSHPTRQGCKWTPADITRLRDGFDEGKSDAYIAAMICRSAYAVLCKRHHLNLYRDSERGVDKLPLVPEHSTYMKEFTDKVPTEYEHQPKASELVKCQEYYQKSTEETIMSNVPEQPVNAELVIEDATLINNVNVKVITDEAIISHIQALEAQINTLDSINQASDCIHKKIDTLRDKTRQLAKILDNRCKDC